MKNRPKMGLLLAACAVLASCGDGGGASTPSTPPPSPTPSPTPTATAVRHILFVGDSLTHGRYTPVRSYN